MHTTDDIDAFSYAPAMSIVTTYLFSAYVTVSIMKVTVMGSVGKDTPLYRA